MHAVLPFLVWATIILAISGVVAMAFFAVRALIWGKITKLAISSAAIPVLLTGIFMLATHDGVKGFILTCLVMLCLALLTLVVSGIRSVFITGE